MDSRKNWKLLCTLVLVVLLCGEAGPHVEIFVPHFVPSTTVSIQVSGGYNTNVAAQILSNHFGVTR